MNRFFDYIFKDEPNSCESIAIFRIIFCWSYLWIRVTRGFFEFPMDLWNPVKVLERFQNPPSNIIIVSLHYIVIVFIILTLLGLFTQLSTLGLFLSGTVLSALRHSYMTQPHDAYFMEIYIPFFMIFSGWGDTYSVDAFFRKLPPCQNSWQYSWFKQPLLLLLSLLFLISAYVKFRYGAFLENPQHMSDVFIFQSIRTPIFGLPIQSLGFLLSKYSAITLAFQGLAFFFEGTFWLSLLNRHLRQFYLFGGIGFHIFNGLVLNIFFTPILLIYALYIPWHNIKRYVFPVLVPVLAIASLLLLLIDIRQLHWFTEVGLWYGVLAGFVVTLFWKMVHFMRKDKNKKI
jgi:hypothetical protein